MSKVIFIILNIFLVIIMIGVFSIFFAYIRTLLKRVFSRTASLDKVENRSVFSSIVALVLAIILFVMLILALDSFFWPLRGTVVGWSADKIEKVTGLKKTEKPFEFKFEK